MVQRCNCLNYKSARAIYFVFFEFINRQTQHTSNRTDKVAEFFSQLHIFSIIDRDINNCDPVFLKCLLKNRKKTVSALDSVSFRSKRLRILNKIRIIELHISVSPKTSVLMPLDKSITTVIPYYYNYRNIIA